MRVSSSFTLAVAASVLAAASIRAQLPSGVDLNKPDTVKSYVDSMLSAIAKDISNMSTKLPAEVVSGVREGVDTLTKNIKDVVASATETEVLGAIVSQLSSQEAVLRAMADGGNPALPTSMPGITLPPGDGGSGSTATDNKGGSKDSGKNGDKPGNAAATSAAQLTAGVMAGVAAFAVFF
ncbi:hypothetical protein GQ42DRAFT_162649 [Ramicandelaber brevisporus]|nr:hypothetical protein GQ42DRAFT_162649 [Ramicandelaber brevisporus]